MNDTMRATSQDEFGGPEVLKCLGDLRLVSPRVPNPVNVLLAALTALESAESLQPLPGTEYLNV